MSYLSKLNPIFKAFHWLFCHVFKSDHKAIFSVFLRDVLFEQMQRNITDISH